MNKVGVVLSLLLIMGCRDKKNSTANENSFSFSSFDAKFPATPLPFQLSDTALFKRKDTLFLSKADTSGLFPDSIKSRIFSAYSKTKFVPLAKFNKGKTELYYVIKLVSTNRRSTVLLVFNKNEEISGVFPLFTSYGDFSILRSASIDKFYSITRNIVRKNKSGASKEGKEVYEFNPATRKFNLIMMDAMDESVHDVINPIDSLPAKNMLSGDYILNRRNFVSLRDDRHQNMLMCFVHMENEAGDCIGELKGNLQITSPTTAIYRHGGDPCVLDFAFHGNTVSLKEEEGCGSHRGVDCSFDGVFHKKIQSKHLNKSKRRTHKLK